MPAGLAPEAKAMRVPSGDHVGSKPLELVVRRVSVDVAGSKENIS
jgi:hypothetical protein